MNNENQLKSEKVEEIAWRNSIKEITKELENYPNNLQNIHTPFDLCNCIISKLKESMGDFSGKDFCTFNLEFVDILCYDFNVPLNRIWFVTDCKEKAKIAKHERYKEVNVVLDWLKWEMNMKFDVVIMNPPYQKKSNSSNTKTQAIWDDFVRKAFEIVKNHGFVAAIHPSGWRDIDGQFKEIQNILKSKNIKYLEIHDRNDGVKVFGVQTAYDWYVVENSDTTGLTNILGHDKKEYHINISKMEFIPNGMFNDIISLIAKKGEDKVEVARDASNFHTQKPWMSNVKTDEFKYPCVYTILKDGTINLWYSNTNIGGHFNIPKVIFSNGSSKPIVDANGEYGLTQFAYAIIDKNSNLEKIKEAMENKQFIEIMDKCQLVGKHRYHYKAISMFRKDFWKEFVQ